MPLLNPWKAAASFITAAAIFSLFAAAPAQAMSAACSALNNASPLSSGLLRYQPSDFESGESLTVSSSDTGLGFNGNPTTADSVILAGNGGFPSYSRHTSDTSHAGSFMLQATSAQLTANGLYFKVSTSNGYISPVTVSCTSASTPPAASTDASLSNLTVSAGPLSPSFSAGRTSYSLNVANNISSLQVTPVATDSGASITVNGTPVISGSPSPSVPLAEGSNTLSVVVMAADGATTTSYSINAIRAGQLPTAGPVAANVMINSSNNPITLALSGASATSVAIATLPAHGSVTVDNLQIIYTPTPGYSGSDSFSYNASNNAGTSADASVTITIDAPTLSLTPTAGTLTPATLGSVWTQTFTASGGSGPYTYSASGLPPGLSLNPASGEVSGSPVSAGTYTFQITATDSASYSVNASYTLVVNALPPSAAPVSEVIATDSSDNLITLPLSGGEATSVAVVQPPSHGTATAVGLKIRYTPLRGYAGSDSFTYTATNNFGTTQEATVTLTVNPAVLTLSPAAGALPRATVGTAYSQTFSVSGGSAPYSWHLSGNLPDGLTFADGELKGTPLAAASVAFTLQATDANGASAQSTWQLEINAAAPVAVDHAASLYAGQSVKINLSAGATGGAFTGARLLDQPASSVGTAEVESAGSDYNLVFKAAPQASGTTALRYVLLANGGASQPAQVSITIAARPDPSKDADVIGMISAQLRAAQNFAQAQIRNFSDRLTQLHNGMDSTSNLDGIHFALPTSHQQRTTDNDRPGDGLQQYNQLADAPPPPPSPFGPTAAANSRLAYWTGGYVDFGSDKDNSVRFSHTLVGISTGADYRLTPDFTAGMGIGFGRDVSDIGDNGTRNNGRSISSALYSSYHPDAFFVDSLLGYSRLDFDSRRYVSETGAYARGERSGRQLFGAVISGYDFRTPSHVVSPYVGLQFYRTWLDGYAEKDADAFNLAFAPQAFSQFTAVTGIRGQYGVPLHWGLMRLQSRVEYAQLMNDTGYARLGYADTGNDSWNMKLSDMSKSTLSLGVGVDFLLAHGITPGIAWQGMLGLDNNNSRSQSILLRVNVAF
ncbi:autotransporter domain-containing protein [Izhakiella australiensis]|uniref:autotransporter family protein n=1 Tax=Izhakiella australiensis TaxID=1926881 RepID=UPI0009902E8D|nr:autotransporter domain-containing protein [Izhakiella australiensis]